MLTCQLNVERVALFKQSVSRHHVPDRAELKHFLSRYRLTKKKHGPGSVCTDHSRKLGTGPQQTDVDLGYTEGRLLRGDYEIAKRYQCKASSDRWSIDGGNYGHGTVVESPHRIPDRPTGIDEGRYRLALRGQWILSQILSSHERSRTAGREDYDAVISVF